MAKHRPILRYYGGKWKLAPWIISFMPSHTVYVEPYGGAASVLIRKPRSRAEIYNDVDGDVVNLFQVLRYHADELARVCALTPYARLEYDQSYEPGGTDIERARKLVYRSYAGFGGDSYTRHNGFRTRGQNGDLGAAWRNMPSIIYQIADRMQGVLIECRDALSVMREYDGPSTLHYVDPPYLMATRRRPRSTYVNERTTGDEKLHEDLARFLRGLSGFVMLSGYANEIYRDILNDWHCIERSHMAEKARPTVEMLWISPNTPAPQLSLHAELSNTQTGN